MKGAGFIAGPAFVTGGSSGIGLAVARALSAEGRPVAIFARDESRLGRARSEIQAAGQGRRCLAFPVDVTDAGALGAAVATAAGDLGAPAFAIASAGLAEPGLFLDQPLAAHRRQLETNYVGTLNFVHAVAPRMRDAGGGRIGLVASGAAFVGIYGYSAYAPSKFAVRGLAEVLRVELAEHGIGVTLCCPPDTDTPQLRAEAATKPEATRRITAAGGVLSAETVAAALIDGMRRDRFLVAPGLQMRLLASLGSLLAPALRLHQHRVVRRTGRKGA